MTDLREMLPVRTCDKLSSLNYLIGLALDGCNFKESDLATHFKLVSQSLIAILRSIGSRDSLAAAAKCREFSSALTPQLSPYRR